MRTELENVYSKDLFLKDQDLWKHPDFHWHRFEGAEEELKEWEESGMFWREPSVAEGHRHKGGPKPHKHRGLLTSSDWRDAVRRGS